MKCKVAGVIIQYYRMYAKANFYNVFTANNMERCEKVIL